MTDQTEPMSRADRQSLVQLSKARAKQSEREAESQEKILLAELQDLLTAEFEGHERLWAEAVIIAEDAVEKANAQVRAQCADLGIPAKHTPKLELGWRSRSEEFGSGARRAELRKLAEARAAALKSTAKAEIQRRELLQLLNSESAARISIPLSLPRV